MPADLRKPQPGTTGVIMPLGEALAVAEKQCIINALAHSSGNRTKAAATLAISRKNLWEKMKLHQIEY